MALSMTSTSVYGQAAAHANGPGRAPISVDSDWLMAKSPFQHADPEDPRRSIGWGKPLRGTSWRNRPYHAGWTVGALIGDSLIHGHVDQGNRVFGAYRIGWDFDHYWGTEFRFAFANLEVIDGSGSLDARNSRHLYWDGNLLYYPWGDSQWRPYAMFGMGMASFRFRDDMNRRFNETLLEMPFGVGVKYQTRNWLAVRFDLKDNFAVSAAGLATMHSISLTGGVEVHFGGQQTSYFPWDSSVHLY